MLWDEARSVEGQKGPGFVMFQTPQSPRFPEGSGLKAGLSYTRIGRHILRMDAVQTHRYRATQRVLTAGGLPHYVLAALASPVVSVAPDWFGHLGPVIRCPRIRGVFRHLHPPTGQQGDA